MMLAFSVIFLALTVSSISVHGYLDSCEVQKSLSGEISSNASYYLNYTACWKINVPENNSVTINVTKLNFRGMPCNKGYIEIKATDYFYSRNAHHRFCSEANVPQNLSYNASDIEVIYHHNSNRERSSFSLQYHIETSVCLSRDHFRCSKHICIPKHKVCDGIKDCKNGSDEIGCGKDTRITSIDGLNKTLANAISWLMKQRLPSYGWSKNTHRAITALYLSGGASFHGNNSDQELMVKQLELETAVALLRDSKEPLSVNDLSMYINALLVTCHNPSKFYGHDLVQILSKRVSSMKSPSPGSYLTLCNANFTFLESDIQKIFTILEQDSNYPFYSDIQAMAIMAINCILNKRDIVYNEITPIDVYNGRGLDYFKENGEVDYETYNQTDSVYTEIVTNFTEINEDDYEFHNHTDSMKIYNETLMKFMRSQQYDGSFGNIYSTSLVIQALISSGQKFSSAWNVKAAMKYLMSKLKSPFHDFLSTTLALPIFNGKSLVDIGNIKCRKQRRTGEEVPPVLDKLGDKMQIKYSLYIGDDKDIVHTMYLRVPENSSAYDVMRVGQEADPKYKFYQTTVSGSIYVYGIAEITNDPEAGKFWLLYKGNDEKYLTQHSESPDKLTLSDGNHLVMWYKTVQY